MSSSPTATSPRRDVNAVDPTTSVNTNVMVFARMSDALTGLHHGRRELRWAAA